MRKMFSVSIFLLLLAKIFSIMRILFEMSRTVAISCTWKILEASVGTSSRDVGRAPLFLGKYVIPKRIGGLTDACCDGKLMPIFRCRQPVPVAALSTASVCGRSHAEIAWSNPAESNAACLFWMLCVIRQRFLRRADIPSREYTYSEYAVRGRTKK
jgi:hypothetical protein